MRAIDLPGPAGGVPGTVLDDRLYGGLRRRRLAACCGCSGPGARAARSCRLSCAGFRSPRNGAAMPRYKLTIEYDGSGLVGWQRQANGLSVQEALETAVTDFCGESVTVHGAGRTDAGVHALAQTAHLDLARARSAGRPAQRHQPSSAAACDQRARSRRDL